jgi:hypothetical protein
MKFGDAKQRCALKEQSKSTNRSMSTRFIAWGRLKKIWFHIQWSRFDGQG